MDFAAAPMHEALVTRGHVYKADKEIRHYVFHPCNVVFRHDHCPAVEVELGYDNITGFPVKEWVQFSHGGGTGGQLQFERCAMSLIAYEGYDRVHEYLKAMTTLFPQVGRESYDRFMEFVGRNYANVT